MIFTLIISSVSNNPKRWSSAYFKGCALCSQLPVHNHLLPSSHIRVRVSQSSCISHTLLNFFVSKFPQTDNLPANCYAEDFTVSCSNSNDAQMAEALTAHASNIDWPVERDLTISATKNRDHFFYPSIRKFSTHPQVTQNNFLSCYLLI